MNKDLNYIADVLNRWTDRRVKVNQSAVVLAAELHNGSAPKIDLVPEQTEEVLDMYVYDRDDQLLADMDRLFPRGSTYRTAYTPSGNYVQFKTYYPTAVQYQLLALIWNRALHRWERQQADRSAA